MEEILKMPTQQYFVNCKSLNITAAMPDTCVVCGRTAVALFIGFLRTQPKEVSGLCCLKLKESNVKYGQSLLQAHS